MTLSSFYENIKTLSINGIHIAFPNLFVNNKIFISRKGFAAAFHG